MSARRVGRRQPPVPLASSNADPLQQVSLIIRVGATSEELADGFCMALIRGHHDGRVVAIIASMDVSAKL